MDNFKISVVGISQDKDRKSLYDEILYEDVSKAPQENKGEGASTLAIKITAFIIMKQLRTEKSRKVVITKTSSKKNDQLL